MKPDALTPSSADPNVDALRGLLARHRAPTARKAWWEKEHLGFGAVQPKELVAHAAIYFPADIWLQDVPALDRVAEHYIAYSRKLGYWAHWGSTVPFHASGLSGYRDRLKEYRAILRWSLAR